MVSLRPGDCVRVPDGRPGRVRDRRGDKYRIRVRRVGGTSDEFLLLPRRELVRIDPPAGWMSLEGYNRRVAAVKRNARSRSAGSRGRPVKRARAG